MSPQNEFIELFPTTAKPDPNQVDDPDSGEGFHALFEKKTSKEEKTDSFDVMINEEESVIRSIDVTCNCGCGRQVRIILDYEMPV
jgi:hypothetical protein